MKTIREYHFKNGVYTVEKIYRTKTQYEYWVKVDLMPDTDGTKRLIRLDRVYFITLRGAIDTTNELLKRFKLL